MNSTCVCGFVVPGYNLDFVMNFTNVYWSIMWTLMEKFKFGIKLEEYKLVEYCLQKIMK